jgi:hypothetical protein
MTSLPSHGRGRWFEPSIAHLKKVALCRKNVNVVRRPGIKPGLLYTSSTPMHRYSMRAVCR